MVLRSGVLKVAMIMSSIVVIGLVVIVTLLMSRETQGEAGRVRGATAEETQVPDGSRVPKSPLDDGMRPSSKGTTPNQTSGRMPGDSSTAIDKVGTPTAWSKSVQRLKELTVCANTQQCDFPKGAPASYDLAVQDAIATEIRNMTMIATEFAERSGRGFPEPAQEAARHFLEIGNDDVKEAAIHLLSQAPPSERNLQALVSALKVSVSGPLYRQGLTELGRYDLSQLEPETRAQLDSFLIATLDNGGVAASREVARASFSFLRKDNVAAYSTRLKQLPVRSPAYEYLKLNLEEFARMQRGG